MYDKIDLCDTDQQCQIQMELLLVYKPDPTGFSLPLILLGIQSNSNHMTPSIHNVRATVVRHLLNTLSGPLWPWYKQTCDPDIKLPVFLPFTLVFNITSFVIATTLRTQFLTLFVKKCGGSNSIIDSDDNCTLHAYDNRCSTIAVRTVFRPCLQLIQVGSHKVLCLPNLSRADHDPQ